MYNFVTNTCYNNHVNKIKSTASKRTKELKMKNMYLAACRLAQKIMKKKNNDLIIFVEPGGGVEVRNVFTSTQSYFHSYKAFIEAFQ